MATEQLYRPSIIVFLLNFVSQSSSAGFGTFRVELQNFELCPEVKNPKVVVDVKQKKLDRNTNAYDITFNNTIPFDDSITALIEVSQLGTRGGYQENVYVKEFPKTCSTFKTFIPGIFMTFVNEVKKATGEDLSVCRLKQGSRFLKNVVFKDKTFEIGQLPFWYNKYIMKETFKKDNKVVGCLKAYLELLPRNKRG